MNSILLVLKEDPEEKPTEAVVIQLARIQGKINKLLGPE